ncbi:hypothetical protein I7I51_02354 [Histoplasma capsulatum]|uniref:Uncharacterized protein n=1 Tax=Ajellomyces capsulatus TaxID=5037 RepID=A0A8A1MA23_AJECA|nr:hypothetical protein I7I51_02354 [Histoplasma capsulatum]
MHQVDFAGCIPSNLDDSRDFALAFTCCHASNRSLDDYSNQDVTCQPSTLGTEPLLVFRDQHVSGRLQSFSFGTGVWSTLAGMKNIRKFYCQTFGEETNSISINSKRANYHALGLNDRAEAHLTTDAGSWSTKVLLGIPVARDYPTPVKQSLLSLASSLVKQGVSKCAIVLDTIREHCPALIINAALPGSIYSLVGTREHRGRVLGPEELKKSDGKLKRCAEQIHGNRS